MNLAWLLERLYRPLLRRAAREILEGRRLDPDRPERGRWLRADVNRYLADTWRRVRELMPDVGLEALPTLGNRHNVFLAVVTTAAYQTMLDRGLSREQAIMLTGDAGWKVYSWMIGLAGLPARLSTRDPQGRMDRTLRALLVFPFSAPGALGYEVEARAHGDRFSTRWTHCPPQTFVRELIERDGDRGELDAFAQTWCLYDWAAADLLADDGEHGHYTRPHTLSRGDSVCDMCWHGRPIPCDRRSSGSAEGRYGQNRAGFTQPPRPRTAPASN